MMRLILASLLLLVSACASVPANAPALRGKDNGNPGPREGVENHYGAFVLDPDGNNIEACYRS
jgi:hypothetical protein